MVADPSSSLTCDLPGEVMLEILSRIPIKYLLKFKCVSEAWYSLFRNSFFIKKHFDYPSKVEGDGFLVIGQDSEFNIGTILPGSIKWESMGIFVPHKLQCVGSLKGLICLTPINKFKHGSEFLVMNLILRESITTYKELVCARKPQKCELMSIGFGFDPEHNDFKIVRIEQLKEELGLRCSDVNIYSLRTNSWKKVECAANIRLSSRFAMPLGNLVCWRSNPRALLI